MKIRFFGHRNILGGGVQFSNFVDSFKKIATFNTVVEEADPVNPEQFRDACLSSRPDDINIHFSPYPIHHPLQGINIIWAIFESTVAPQIYLNFYRRMNGRLYWVPSAWGKQMLCNAGVLAGKIDVVPEGVDPYLYHPYFRAAHARTPPYKFLTIGKYEERKGHKELLRAFRQAFDNDPRVQLVCKADYFHPQLEVYHAKKDAFLALVESLGLTNVDCVWGTADLGSLLLLYTNCDAFVYPTKAEGWGLPLIDAIACGLPVITTNHSGHTEFIRHLSSSLIKVDYDLVPIVSEDPDYANYYPSPSGDHGLWASPRVDSIARGLQYCFENRERLAQEAIKASSIIRSRVSWDQAAITAMDSLIAHGFFKIQ